MNINLVTLSGNLTANPEMKFTPGGKAVCSLRLANNMKLKDGQVKTTFIDVVCWEKTAEVANQYLIKGSPVLVEARLDMETWTDKQTGANRTKHVLTVSRLHLFPATRPAELEGEGSASRGAEAPAGGAGGEAENPFA